MMEDLKGAKVTGSDGRRYVVEDLLGCGIAGKTYSARAEDNNSRFCIKFSYSESEFADIYGSKPSEFIVKAFRIIFQDLHSFYLKIKRLHVPKFSDFIEDDSTSRSCLITPEYKRSLQTELRDIKDPSRFLSLNIEIIESLKEVLERSNLSFHGALKPSNIFLDEGGGVILTDFTIPSMKLIMPELIRSNPSLFDYLPPEVRRDESIFNKRRFDVKWNPIDFYTLSLSTIRWLMYMGFTEVSMMFGENALNQKGLSILKTCLEMVMERSGVSPYFKDLLLSRWTSTLKRALSFETSPSPPHRFYRYENFHERLAQLLSLTNPSIKSISQPIFLDFPNKFTPNIEIKFSVRLSCSYGVNRDDLIDVKWTITGKYGRIFSNGNIKIIDIKSDRETFLFKFSIQGLMEGDYQISLTFSLKGVVGSERIIEFPLSVLPPLHEGERVELAFPQWPEGLGDTSSKKNYFDAVPVREEIERPDGDEAVTEERVEGSEEIEVQSVDEGIVESNRPIPLGEDSESEERGVEKDLPLDYSPTEMRGEKKVRMMLFLSYAVLIILILILLFLSILSFISAEGI